MFGYVTVNKPEIKFKDFDMYRSFYYPDRMEILSAAISTAVRKPLIICPAFRDRLLFVRPHWKMYLWNVPAVI